MVDDVIERYVVLDVTLSGPVVVSTDLVRMGIEVVMGRVVLRVGNGVSVWGEVNRSGLAVVRVMALAGCRCRTSVV